MARVKCIHGQSRLLLPSPHVQRHHVFKDLSIKPTAYFIDEEALTSLELELGLHRVRDLPELFLGQSEFDCFSDLGSAPPAGSVSC